MNQRHQDELTQYHFNIETEDIERIFETLLRELRPLIFRKIGYITSNQFDIEDMYQEIIIKCIEHFNIMTLVEQFHLKDICTFSFALLSMTT